MDFEKIVKDARRLKSIDEWAKTVETREAQKQLVEELCQ